MNIQKVKLLRISFLGMALAFSLGYLVASLLVCVSQGDPILFMSVIGSHKTILRTPRCGSRVSGAVTLIYTPEGQPPQKSRTRSIRLAVVCSKKLTYISRSGLSTKNLFKTNQIPDKVTTATWFQPVKDAALPCTWPVNLLAASFLNPLSLLLRSASDTAQISTPDSSDAFLKKLPLGQTAAALHGLSH